MSTKAEHGQATRVEWAYCRNCGAQFPRSARARRKQLYCQGRCRDDYNRLRRLAVKRGESVAPRPPEVQHIVDRYRNETGQVLRPYEAALLAEGQPAGLYSHAVAVVTPEKQFLHLCDTQAEALATAGYYQRQGWRAWPVELYGEGKARDNVSAQLGAYPGGHRR